jgi:ketosteroid isomerase-like protein
MLAMDSAGIAAMFAPDGEMVNPKRPPVRGRAAIERFLSGFSDFHVVSNVDEATSTVVDVDTAEQLGTYRQRVRSPDGQVFETKGRFEIGWVRDASGDWLLSQVATFPSDQDAQGGAPHGQ